MEKNSTERRIEIAIDQNGRCGKLMPHVQCGAFGGKLSAGTIVETVWGPMRVAEIGTTIHTVQGEGNYVYAWLTRAEIGGAS